MVLRQKQTGPFFFKLYLLDYLIIIVVLVVGLIIFSFLHQKQKWVTVTVVSENTPSFIATSLHKGDSEVNSSGGKIAQIIEMEVYPVGPSQLSLSPPIAIVPTAKTNRDIVMQVKLYVRVNPRSGELEYKGKIIKVGLPIELRFNKVMLKGVLAGLEEGKIEQKEKVVSLSLFNQPIELANSIVIGGGETDQTTKKIIEIISKTVNPTGDPQKVDIILKAKILVQQLPKGELVFRKRERVAVGEYLSFTLEKVTITDALIAGIE